MTGKKTQRVAMTVYVMWRHARAYILFAATFGGLILLTEAFPVETRAAFPYVLIGGASLLALAFLIGWWRVASIEAAEIIDKESKP